MVLGDELHVVPRPNLDQGGIRALPVPGRPQADRHQTTPMMITIATSMTITAMIITIMNAALIVTMIMVA